ncbi:MAG: hypothetical protein Q7K42_03285, partial [Candidatus Diapherotrites archaeon]|nr:hypothetical protein [Candidatus Diapherotrites archaeon]
MPRVPRREIEIRNLRFKKPASGSVVSRAVDRFSRIRSGLVRFGSKLTNVHTLALGGKLLFSGGKQVGRLVPASTKKGPVLLLFALAGCQAVGTPKDFRLVSSVDRGSQRAHSEFPLTPGSGPIVIKGSRITDVLNTRESRLNLAELNFGFNSKADLVLSAGQSEENLTRRTGVTIQRETSSGIVTTRPPAAETSETLRRNFFDVIARTSPALFGERVRLGFGVGAGSQSRSSENPARRVKGSVSNRVIFEGEMPAGDVKLKSRIEYINGLRREFLGNLSAEVGAPLRPNATSVTDPRVLAKL